MGVAAALERQQQARARGDSVLSVVAAETPSTWGAWAASRGCLTLLVEEADHERAIESLLAQFPWARAIAAARTRFAATAKLAEAAIDAALDARGDVERWRWIVDQVAHDDHALVAGWLLVVERSSAPARPPLEAARLLGVACDLAAPIAIAFHHTGAERAWLDEALASAAALVTQLPRHAVGLVAPRAVLAHALEGSTSSVHAFARAGLVEHVEETPASTHESARARSSAERALHEALARDRRTAGKFTLNARLVLDVTREIDFVAASARLAVEIDGWFHFQHPDRYRADRRKDLVLQQAGYLVMRYLASDVSERIEYVVDQIARVLLLREAAR